MTTKNKQITNEQVAEALGFVRIAERFHTWTDLQSKDLYELPDFLNDLNAAWKYVWPDLKKHYQGIAQSPIDDFTGQQVLEQILWDAFVSENPALYLCQRFIDLKQGEINEGI